MRQATSHEFCGHVGKFRARGVDDPVPLGRVMIWEHSYRFDPAVRPLADRHYNRRAIGSPQFVPPGRCVVLRCPDAFWVTSWPFAEHVRHQWPGSWMCSAFRNELPERLIDGTVMRSSDLIRQAVAATRWYWPDTPSLGMMTFVNERKVRTKRDPGRCFLRAGFRRLDQRTKGGLIVLQLLPADMPDAEPPLGAQVPLFEGVS